MGEAGQVNVRAVQAQRLGLVVVRPAPGAGPLETAGIVVLEQQYITPSGAVAFRVAGYEDVAGAVQRQRLRVVEVAAPQLVWSSSPRVPYLSSTVADDPGPKLSVTPTT